jgi:hypothetical protein
MTISKPARGSDGHVRLEWSPEGPVGADQALPAPRSRDDLVVERPLGVVEALGSQGRQAGHRLSARAEATRAVGQRHVSDAVT